MPCVPWLTPIPYINYRRLHRVSLLYAGPQSPKEKKRPLSTSPEEQERFDMLEKGSYQPVQKKKKKSM